MKGAIALGLVVAVSAAARADQPKPAGGPAAGAPAAPMMRRAPDPTPPPPMPEMKPAPEVTAAAKLMVGSYACKGVEMNPDGSSHPSLLKMKISVELDGYYILVELDQQKTKDIPAPFTAKMYRTYDAASKKWIDTIIASAPGGPMTMTSTDTMGTGSVTWTGSMSMGAQTFTERSHEDPDAKTKSVHVWGEVSLDGGKTFQKEYDVTCKK